jgi:branched-chain amino acid transport system substrate-binding protein
LLNSGKILFGLLALILAGEAQAADGPIRIGTLFSTTGVVGFIGDPEQKSVEQYVKSLNDAGGVIGRKIELVSFDDASDPARANTFTKRLIESEKVDLIVGGTITPIAMAMIPLVERSETPYISVGGGLPIVDPVKKWVFKTPHTDRQVARRILQDMKERSISKIGMLSEQAGFGQSGRKEIMDAAADFGITLLADEKYSPKDTDVTPQLTTIKDAQGVQAILIFCGAGTSGPMAAKNYERLGIKLPLYFPHAVVNQEFIKLTGNAGEGARMPAPLFVVFSAVPASDPQKKSIDAFYSGYQAMFKETPSPFAGNSWDAINIAVDAIRRAGSTDKARLRDAIEQTKELAGLNGVFTMSPTDHHGLSTESLRMFTVTNGAFVLAK